MTEFDLFVIGGGSGGVRAARIAARNGARVGLAEADRVGGTCVIRGCVPKKLMVLAARYRDSFEDSVGFGWSPGEPRFDWPTLMRNVHTEVDRLNAAYIRGLETAGVTVFHERAEIEAPGRLRLGDSGQSVAAANILVATGGHPNRLPELRGGELAITSDEMFGLDRLPERIVIVGAGFVAIEFASIMSGLGVDTTVLHRGGEILRSFDENIRTAMHRAMEQRGIRIIVDDELAEIARQEDERLLARTVQGEMLAADQVLLAIGRTPNTDGIGLDEVGVARDADGAVVVDAASQSTVPGIYAIGDVTNRINLTPVAIREGHTLADRLFAGATALVDHADVPHAVFGTPEIGCVGLTEEEALAAHSDVDIYQASFRPMSLQFSERDEPMLIKLIVDAASDRVLGCHLLGPDAAEMIQLVAVAVKMKATKADFDATMALHPTAAEEIVTMRQPTRRHRRAAAE